MYDAAGTGRYMQYMEKKGRKIHKGIRANPSPVGYIEELQQIHLAGYIWEQDQIHSHEGPLQNLCTQIMAISSMFATPKMKRFFRRCGDKLGLG